MDFASRCHVRRIGLYLDNLAVLTSSRYYLTFCHPRTLSFLLTFRWTGEKIAHLPQFNPSRPKIEIPDRDYRTIARWACRRLTSVETYSTLLEDPFIGHHLPTHLRMASSIRRVPFVEHLLSIGVDPNLPDTQGKYSLSAVANKRVTRYRTGTNILDLLLANGADPNVRDARYGPPLIGAVRFAIESPSFTKGTSMAEQLLEAGANINAVSACPPLNIKNNVPDLARCYGTALTTACKVAAASTVTYEEVVMSIVTLLLDPKYGADINLPCPLHGSPLMVTAMAAAIAPPGSGNRGINLTKFLLERGADANAVHPTRGSVLSAACNIATESGRKDGPAIKILKLLVDYGANVNQLDAKLGSPLIAVALASKRRRGPGLELLQWLLEKGANPNLVSPAHGTALMRAAEAAATGHTSRTKAMKILIEHGARVVADGVSALEAAKACAMEMDAENWKDHFVVKFLEEQIEKEVVLEADVGADGLETAEVG